MRLLAGLAVAAMLAGCANSGPDVSSTTIVHTVTRTPPTSQPRPAPTGPIDAGPITAVEGDCPYLSVADASTKEGNRIDKHYVLVARGKPVGCRFMFWTNAYAVLEIVSQAYADADAAYNAMVRTGMRGGNYHGVKDLVPGVDAMLYQTTFYPPDGPTDWACTFAKGSTLVTVKTAQNNVEFNAREIAASIAPRF